MPECTACGASLHPAQLVCPRCAHLVHSERLKALAAEARGSDDPSRRLALWREALELLPAGSGQATKIRARIAADVEAVDAGATGSGSWLGRMSGVGGIVGAVALLLSKGKLLLLGLTKWKMMASMFLSLGVYWTVFGWRFAVGLIVSLYVHEMGHVFALQRYGIRASAPMFIPGLGAYVRLDQYPQSAREDATIGLAGPVWGIAAALVAWGVGMAMGWPSWVAIGKVGGWLNIFNLVPFWQLDGARALRALDGMQRWLLMAGVVGMWMLTGDGILILIGLVLAWRIWTDRIDEPGSWRIFWTFLAVMVIGSGMTLIEVPGIP